MKKSLIVSLLLILSLPLATYSQLDKGSWFGSLSANLGYNHNSSKVSGWDNNAITANIPRPVAMPPAAISGKEVASRTSGIRVRVWDTGC